MAAPKVDQAYLKAVAGARGAIKALLQTEKATPLVIRLAFGDALTFDRATNTGGANGSIRTRKELEHPGNEGLDSAIKLLGDVKSRYPALSYAGGDPVPHLRSLAARLGMALRQLVALAGVHPLGRWWPDPEPLCYDRHTSTSTPSFGNSYFKDVLAGKADAWLLRDEEIAHMVAAFAADEATFAQEYAAAHEALSRLGTRLTPQAAPAAPGRAGTCAGLIDLDRAALVQVAVAATAAVAAGAIIMGLYWRRRRRLGL